MSSCITWNGYYSSPYKCILGGGWPNSGIIIILLLLPPTRISLSFALWIKGGVFFDAFQMKLNSKVHWLWDKKFVHIFLTRNPLKSIKTVLYVYFVLFYTYIFGDLCWMSLVLLCVPPNTYYYVLFFTKFPLTFNYHGAFISNSIWGVSLSINYPLYIDWYNSPAIGFHFRLIEEGANKFFWQFFKRFFWNSWVNCLNDYLICQWFASSMKVPYWRRLPKIHINCL